MTTLVIGAGPIGRHVTQRLVDTGTPVRVGTRGDRRRLPAGAEHLRLDATNRDDLDAALRDVDVLHLCTHASRYRPDVWERELPALETNVLAAASRHGVTVVFPESLYAFDPTEVVTESSALSPQMAFGRIRARLLQGRAASPARTISVIASDYYGPGAGENAHAGDRMVQPATTGGAVRPLGSSGVEHAWTYLPDLAATMVATAALPPSDDLRLIAPSTHATQAEMARAFAGAAGREDVRVSPLPSLLLRTAGLIHRGSRALADTLPMFERPLRVDATATTALLGIEATPVTEGAAATVAARSGRAWPEHDAALSPHGAVDPGDAAARRHRAVDRRP